MFSCKRPLKKHTFWLSSHFIAAVIFIAIAAMLNWRFPGPFPLQLHLSYQLVWLRAIRLFAGLSRQASMSFLIVVIFLKVWSVKPWSTNLLEWRYLFVVYIVTLFDFLFFALILRRCITLEISMQLRVLYYLLLVCKFTNHLYGFDNFKTQLNAFYYVIRLYL